MFGRFVVLHAVSLLSVVFASAEFTVENGGYSVLVSFSQNVPADTEKAELLLENLAASLQEASEVLHKAIGLQFSKVTFKIPASWDTSEWNITKEGTFSHRNDKTDFLVDNANDVVFGKFPFTQQYGSCGTPGHQITIPTAFFDEDNHFPKGISLAREWLKYRYGVFDENGYVNDPLYPQYYTIPGSDPDEIKITECTNAELTYNILGQNDDNCSTTGRPLIDKLNDKECKIQVDENNSENVTSSLMYFLDGVFTMQHICGMDSDHQHNSRARNKQNILCSGQSIWDVMKNSDDFKNVETRNEEHIDIEYTYIQETKPTVVVAWENTKIFKPKGTVILNAINKFMIDLPYGSKFGAFPFINSLITKDYRLHHVNELADKQKIASGIFSDFLVKEDGNIIIAIEKAVDMLMSTAENAADLEGTIIIVTQSSGGLKDVSDVGTKLKDLKVCIKILSFSEGEVTEEIKQFASTLPCGVVEELSMSDENNETFDKIYEAMETILPSTIDDKAIETVAAGYVFGESIISIEVDDLVENVMFWAFTKRESDNFLLKLNGEEITFPSSHTIGDIVELSYSPSQAGIIELAFPHDVEPILTQARATSKAGKYFTGEILIHDTTEEGSAIQMPVIIYAIIRFGAYPVQNAKVFATIQMPDDRIIGLELYDDGKGNPDITQNDGIYSRYFTKFTGEGEYIVTVTVENNGYVTTYGNDKNAGYHTCCGSYVNGETTRLKQFSKEFRTTFTARSGRPEDGYKPSRITDLRVDKFIDDKITLKWSAPGEEADYGTVQSYEIKHFTSQEEAVNKFDEGNEVLNFTAPPKESGQSETFIINLSDFENSGLYYVAMKAKNANKTSELSNVIEFYVSDQKITSTPETDDKDEKVKAGSTNSKTIGLIIGIIVGIMVLVIIVYLVIYIVIVRPKRKNKKRGKDNPIYETTPGTENNTLNSINFVSADTLIKHHNEKTKAKLENKEPPIFKEEDFEDKNPEASNESGESNNDQQPESSSKTLSNERPMPPKSPKRTTFV